MIVEAYSSHQAEVDDGDGGAVDGGISPALQTRVEEGAGARTTPQWNPQGANADAEGDARSGRVEAAGVIEATASGVSLWSPMHEECATWESGARPSLAQK